MILLVDNSSLIGRLEVSLEKSQKFTVLTQIGLALVCTIVTTFILIKIIRFKFLESLRKHCKNRADENRKVSGSKHRENKINLDLKHQQFITIELLENLLAIGKS